MKRKVVLSTGDTILTIVVITPLVVAYWRGVWCIMDQNSQIFPGVHSFFFGGSLHLSFAILRDLLKESICFKEPTLWNRIKSQIIRKIYSYIFSIACIMHWRGGWEIIDLISEGSDHTVVAIGAFCALVLVFMKCFKNSMAPPIIVVLDNEDVVFSFPTRFNVRSSDKTSLYILDCLFSVFVIGSLVVFVWRGAWVLFDVILFPDDLLWSSWVSLILGYAIVAMAFSMQPAMRWICDRLTGFCRICVSDLFMFFSIVGTINVWRGIWNLLEFYFLPDHPEISCWITHWVSLCLLILLNCSNSLLVRGVYIDAEEPAGKCVVFPIYYLRLIFKDERQKKRIRNIQLEAMVKRKHEIDCLKPKNENCTCNFEQNHVLLLQQTQNHHAEV